MDGVVLGRAVLQGSQAAISAPWWKGVELSLISMDTSERRNLYLFRTFAMVGIATNAPGRGITMGVMPAVQVVDETL